MFVYGLDVYNMSCMNLSLERIFKTSKWYFIIELQNIHIFIIQQDIRGRTHDKDKHDLALLHKTSMHLVLFKIICTHKNPCLMGCPCTNKKNSKFIICVSKNPKDLTFHISISYLLTASKCTYWKSHYCMSYNSTTTLPIIHKLPP
jgi:hypothetical protein